MGFCVCSECAIWRNSANPGIRLALAGGGCVSLCDDPAPGDLIDGYIEMFWIKNRFFEAF